MKKNRRVEELHYVPIQEELNAGVQLVRLMQLAKFIMGEVQAQGLPEEKSRRIAFAAED